MRTVTIGVSSIEETNARALTAFSGEKQGEFISFESVELLWTVLTPRRWEIIQAMAGKGAMSLRAIARLVGRDVKTTHGDVHAMLNAGVLERTDEGLLFPYDAVHVDFTVGKAA
jgi:predicted transcriptional regulator